MKRDIVDRFRIGYAPDSWNEVLRRFGATDEARRALLAGGLIVERDTPRAGSEPWYDRFRDRVMFPIRDPRGRVLGFGGRLLAAGEPKYLNSPETALFHKGQELYGLHEIRLARTALKRLVIVEGYMDVVRLHQAGIAYAVATLGTATTPEHLKRVFRLVSEVVFAFDGDRAGRAAAWRALQNVLPELREGRELRFLFLPEGEDPDSLVGREGSAAFEARLAKAVPLSEYLATQLREQADLSHADGRAKFVALARPLLAKIPQGVYLELLLARIAQDVSLSADRLRELLRADLAAGPFCRGLERGQPAPGARGLTAHLGARRGRWPARPGHPGDPDRAAFSGHRDRHRGARPGQACRTSGRTNWAASAHCAICSRHCASALAAPAPSSSSSGVSAPSTAASGNCMRSGSCSMRRRQDPNCSESSIV